MARYVTIGSGVIGTVRWFIVVYLESDFDLLSQRPFWEYGLDLRDDRRADHASFWPDGVDLLPNAGDDGKILGEIGGQDAGDAVCAEVFDCS